MTDIQEDDQEQELSPAALKIQRKLRNLLIGSTLVMVLGFTAVFGVILYRITGLDSSGSDSNQLTSTIEIEPGAKVRSAIVENGKVFVLIDNENGTSLHILDAESGKPIGKTNFVNR